MPLRAHLGQRDVYAPDVPVDEWQAYKGRKPRPTLFCGQEAVAKTSVLGNQYFAHLVRIDDHEHKGESPEHLAIKAAIVEAARAAGWKADVEVPPVGRRDWVADVLATRGNRKIAFEVQLASQTHDEYVHRQTRYELDGVECLWLVRRLHEEIHQGLPAVQVDPQTLTVSAGKTSDETAALEAFISSVLDGHLNWAQTGDVPVAVTCRWGLHECDCATMSIVHGVHEETTLHCPGCRTTSPGPRPVLTSGKPAKDRARRRVSAEFAVGHWNRFTCPSCEQPIDPAYLSFITNDRAPRAETVASSGSAPMYAHWCAASRVIRTTGDVITFINGRLPQQPPPAKRREPTAEELYLQAKQRTRYRSLPREQPTPTTDVAVPSRADRTIDVYDLAVRELKVQAKQDRDRIKEFESVRALRYAKQRRGEIVPPLQGLRLAGKDHLRKSLPAPIVARSHERTAAIAQAEASATGAANAALFPPATDGDECRCVSCTRTRDYFPEHRVRQLWPNAAPRQL